MQARKVMVVVQKDDPSLGSVRCTHLRRPHGIALDGAGAPYVLSEAVSRLLLIPDPDSGCIEGALPTAGRGSRIVSVTANGLWAFSSNLFSHTVSAIDTIDVPPGPVWIVRRAGATFLVARCTTTSR